MISIKPVSDLRNKYSEVEQEVLSRNEPVFLTKNGRGAMVLLSLEQYQILLDDLEDKLYEADMEAEATDKRYTLDEVMAHARCKKSQKRSD